MAERQAPAGVAGALQSRRSLLTGLAGAGAALRLPGAGTSAVHAAPSRSDIPATAADYAAQEFKPWQDMPGMWKPPTDEQWAYMQEDILLIIRFAYARMFRTKAELVEDLEALDDETGRVVMRMFLQTGAFLTSAAAVVDAAQTRILCAGSSILEREDAEEGGGA